jgi:hypothetical protein
MTDTVVGSATLETGAAPEPSHTPLGVRSERTEAFDTLLEEMRKVYASGPQEVLRSLQDRLRRRLRLAPVSAGAAVLFGLTGIGIRLAVVVLATALAGQWTGIPWGRWAVILVFYVVADAGRTVFFPDVDGPTPPRYMRLIEDWTALLPTIVQESDLRDLVGFTRRLYRLPVVATAGVAVGAVMLLAGWLFAPTALNEVPAGSIVLLSLLLYDFGALPIWSNNLVNWATMARQARYDHHLFWPSPADSPEVDKEMRRAIVQASTAGMWITAFLVLTAVLVSWDSPLVLPLAVGFVVIGYLTTIGLAVSNRASVRKIVERSRQQRLAVLRHRINTFESRFADLSHEESERLRDLLFLHGEIRDAATTPAHARTLLRTAAALIVPTIAFVVTVFGEVSAERLLDAIFP